MLRDKPMLRDTSTRGVFAILAAILALPLGPSAVAHAEDLSKTILSKVYDVDKKYKSMKGPSSRQDIVLGMADSPELVWVTGYKAVMVGSDGESPMAQEFMCHSNLDIDVASHQKAVGSTHGFNPRLFTLSQGQFDVKFPAGFGIPLLSTETLALTTQVLNHNIEGEDFKVRHKVSVDYLRDVDAGEMVALFPIGAYGLTLLEGEDGYYGVQDPEEDDHGPGCLPGSNASAHVYTDRQGRTFTGHWVVPPGREENRTLVTELMQLPYDTTVHYIAIHLHPFAESLELRDLSADKTLFKSKARNFEGKIGLDHVDYFSSVNGIELFKDHEYEIVSVYNNTTEQEQDSMAVMYLYARDKVFKKSRVKIPTSEKEADQGMNALQGVDGPR